MYCELWPRKRAGIFYAEVVRGFKKQQTGMPRQGFILLYTSSCIVVYFNDKFLLCMKIPFLSFPWILIVAIAMAPACAVQDFDKFVPGETAASQEPTEKEASSNKATVPTWLLPGAVIGTGVTLAGLCAVSYFAHLGPCKAYAVSEEMRQAVAIDVKQAGRAEIHALLQTWDMEIKQFSGLFERLGLYGLSPRVKAFKYIKEKVESEKLPTQSGTKIQMWVASRQGGHVPDGVLITRKLYRNNKLYLHVDLLSTAPWNTPGYTGNLHPPIKGAGTELMRAAYDFAQRNGYEGIYGNPIKNAYPFYAGLYEKAKTWANGELKQIDNKSGRIHLYLDFPRRTNPVPQIKQARVFQEPKSDIEWEQAWTEALGQVKNPLTDESEFKNAPDRAYIEHLLGLSNLKSPAAVGIDVNLLDLDGDTALLWAVIRKRTKLVSVLVQVPQIDPDVQDKDGDTALIIAVRGKNLQVTQALLAIPGVDVNIKNKREKTALLTAVRQSENQEVIEALGQVSTLNPNIPDNDGNTPLILAVSDENRLSNLKALLTIKGIDITIRNNKGQAALDMAETEEMKKMIRDYAPSH